jgi:hypothetical protein
VTGDDVLVRRVERLVWPFEEPFGGREHPEHARRSGPLGPSLAWSDTASCVLRNRCHADRIFSSSIARRTALDFDTLFRSDFVISL